MKMTEGATGVAHKLLQAIGTLPAKARLGLAAAAVGLPVMAYTLAGDPAPGGGEGGSGAGAPGYYRSAVAVLPVELDSLATEIAGARDHARFEADDRKLDLDDALELFEDRIDAQAPELLDALRDSEPGAELLVGHAASLMAAGDFWGAAANLLVAHERDEDMPTPLLGLAAIGNGQGLAGAALAFAEAALERLPGNDRAHRAAALNNRGHALLLMGEDALAEEALREALSLDPELSEAARNLAHLLLRKGDDEGARVLLPRAAFRLPGKPGETPEVREPASEAPAEGGPADAGSPEEIAQWSQKPWLESLDGYSLRPPLWIALDLSRQGQIAWPEIELPSPGEEYADYARRMREKVIALRGAARERDRVAMQALEATGHRRQHIGDAVQGAIAAMPKNEWHLTPVDVDTPHASGMFPITEVESLILGERGQRTRFQALSVAFAEHHMEEKAMALFRRAEDFRCSSDDYDACCAETRAETWSRMNELLPLARNYEEQMRVFFRDAYGLTSAIASNLPEGPYHASARAQIEAAVLRHVAQAQGEISDAFGWGASPAGLCLDGSGGEPVVPEVSADIPACGPGSQDYSGKWSFGGGFSVEATCGKVKFVAEFDVLSTRRTSFGADLPLEANLGMHAEAEFSIDGTVTVFAGPKAGVAGQIGNFGGDFGVKDGLYLVVGSEGVRDFGMRVVVGGGATAGQGGITHDVEVMDFSFVSAI